MATTQTTEAATVLQRKLVIAGGAPGAPRMQISATVQGASFSGEGSISQALPPPDGSTATVLVGTVSELVNGAKTEHVVEASGHAPFGPEPRPENCSLRMVLDPALDHGTATYRYRDASGHWLGPFNGSVGPA